MVTGQGKVRKIEEDLSVGGGGGGGSAKKKNVANRRVRRGKQIPLGGGLRGRRLERKQKKGKMIQKKRRRSYLFEV